MLMHKFTATLIASVGLSLSPMAGAAMAEESDDGFQTYWSVAMWGGCEEGAGGRNWQEEIDFAGADISRNLIFMNQSRIGLFPKPGIHLFERDPSLWDRHLNKIRADMNRWIPEDFTGLVVIDYERWRPNWDRTRNERNDAAPETAEDHDFLLDWRDAIRDTRREEYYSHGQDTRLQFVYDTYDESALRFYVETIRECKRLRPNAKWSYFNFPKLRYMCDETPRGTIGYGDLTHHASAINDKMQELFDEMDVIVPSIYPQKWTVEGDNFVDFLPQNKQNRSPGNEAFVSSMVAEAMRLGQGKPVYPIVSMQYYFGINPRPWLNELNIRQAIEVSRNAGASGLILWEDVVTPQEWDNLQAMIYDRLAPIIIELVGSSDDSDGGYADGGSGDQGDDINGPGGSDDGRPGGSGGQAGDDSGGKGGRGSKTRLSSVLTVDGD